MSSDSSSLDDCDLLFLLSSATSEFMFSDMVDELTRFLIMEIASMFRETHFKFSVWNKIKNSIIQMDGYSLYLSKTKKQLVIRYFF